MELNKVCVDLFSKKPEVTVILEPGKAKPPFDESCKIAPSADRTLEVYIDPNDFKWAQIAGRTVSSFGLFQMQVKAGSAVKLSLLDAFYFIQGLYDGRHDIKICFADLKEDETKLMDLLTQYVIEARESANGDAATASPEVLASDLIRMLNKSSEGATGELTCSMKKYADADFDYAGLKAVGMGSDISRQSCMAVITYTPEGMKDAPFDVAMAGKGVTFDTGGYDLKPANFMLSMRTDKCGAVYLAYALGLALRLGLHKKTALFLPISDNVVSAAAMKPGDIIKYKNGTTVEIVNTDAEGRLILADALIEAAALKPSVIIDAATLTGAAKNALGRDITAFFCDDPALSAKISSTFADCLEDLWQLPQRSYMKSAIKGRRADLKNSGSQGSPGASTAALFLKHFAGNKKEHIHFDLSSAYSPEESQFWAANLATGSSILSIASYLTGMKFS